MLILVRLLYILTITTSAMKPISTMTPSIIKYHRILLVGGAFFHRESFLIKAYDIDALISAPRPNSAHNIPSINPFMLNGA